MAWHPLGWTPVGFSEIDPKASHLLRLRYPDVPNLGDMNGFREWPDLGPDLIVGGTPCQSYSVAGLRQGLADPRGNLMLVFLGVVDRYRPRWFLWENVPGVLSSNGGRDFGALLGGVAELGYSASYRVLDAQFFGLAQRRERVFVVGHLGDWGPPAAVLLDREGLRRNPPPRRPTREDIAGTIGSRTTAGGGLGTDFELGGGLQPYAGVAQVGPAISPALKARDSKGPSSDGDGDGAPLIAVIPFDTTQITSAANRSNPKPGDPCHPLAAGAHPPAIAHTLRAEGRDASEDGAGRGVPLIAFTSKDAGLDATEDLSPTLRAMGHSGSHANGGGQIAVAVSFHENQRAEVTTSDIAGSLKTGGGKPGQGYPAILTSMAVRRLTPVECERLQGFPDNYTRVPVSRHKERKISRNRPEYRWQPDGQGGWWLMAADGTRYKQLGNSMAVPVMRWIGEQIEAVELLLAEAP